jgi:hypothetical protein
MGAFATAAILAWAGLQNARTATRRHEEQTKADRQRRITESFSKATEQLASEKIEARLGGIYTLERISRESPEDYRIVMETLTAFVRERARWKEPDKIASEKLANMRDDKQLKRDDVQHKDTCKHEASTRPVTLPPPRAISSYPKPATDIAAVLTVIIRRNCKNIYSARMRDLMFDFRGTDLRGADLAGAHLEGADLAGAHLEEANLEGVHLEEANLDSAHLEAADLAGAHLERAYLLGAHLEGTDLVEAHFEGAYLGQAHLERADLREAHLEKAELPGAHLEGAVLFGAHLEGAYIWHAHLEKADLREAGLTSDQINQAFGDSLTILPTELTRPELWSGS